MLILGALPEILGTVALLANPLSPQDIAQNLIDISLNSPELILENSVSGKHILKAPLNSALKTQDMPINLFNIMVKMKTKNKNSLFH